MSLQAAQGLADNSYVLRVGLARGHNPNLVEGQFGKMPGTMKEHNISMQSIFTRFVSAVRWHKLTD